MAEKLLNEAIERENGLGYWEPPHYTRPVLESLGQAYVRAEKYREAEEAYRLLLKARPNSGFALLAIARIKAKSNNTAETSRSYSEFLKVWASADKSLPQVIEAEKWMK